MGCDEAYLRYRAEKEIEQARLATVPEAVQAHRQLAEAYLERVFHAGCSDGGSGSSGNED